MRCARARRVGGTSLPLVEQLDGVRELLRVGGRAHAGAMGETRGA